MDSLQIRHHILALVILCSLTSAQPQPHPYQPGIDIIHYDFNLDLPDTGQIINGDATILFRRTSTVNHLTLDLLSLGVSRVMLDSKDVPFHRDSITVRIPLPDSRDDRDTFSVRVIYGGSVSDGLIIRNESSRWTAFGDNWPNRARRWLPTVDHPSDKATVTWTITAPTNRTIVSNGQLTSHSTSSPGRTRTVWTCHRPIPTYVMVIAVAPLISRDLGLSAIGESEFPGGVRQTLYTFPNQSPCNCGAFDSAVSIVNYFSRLIGPFPYEKLAHLQSSTIFGGMENASAIFYYDKGFRDKGISDDLIAHETAHQWFGDAVTPRTWPHLWLSEGFATYFAELWREQSRGDSLFRVSMADMRNHVIRSKKTIERPVLDTIETNVLSLLNSNSYQKGAWVLHMLRSILGDEVFFRGICAYYTEFRHGTAVTGDLEETMEHVSGRKLGWFFDEWLRRPGFVDAEVAWTFDAEARNVRLSVKQGAQFPPFRFPLTIRLNHGDKTRVQTVEVPAETVSVFDIPWNFDDPPTEFLADPNVSVLGTIDVVRQQPTRR